MLSLKWVATHLNQRILPRIASLMVEAKFVGEIVAMSRYSPTVAAGSGPMVSWWQKV